ncbi:Ig-like domain-containing protein [Gloeothece verrucosa]|uniref:Uncharacterized protein n=1 Tax=Gloeothece verrucosa (strain PCC 7822) TaxID=497965 RepID=E0UL32_GLOV7|nr:cadherin-like domain-containing protein [Gloeothece verrucosa]ADN17662.1 hypothetical protein Cyan7822_5806 [Gloeothece verrucosa PCC 7822]
MAIDINFKNYQISPFNSSQDIKSTVTVSSDGKSLKIVGNGWKSINLPYTITSNTILKFEFQSTAQGEIHGIAFENDAQETPDQSFRLYGTQDWGRNDFNNYSSSAGSKKVYQIPVGQFYTGNWSKLLFINDDDRPTPTAESIFSNVRIYENSKPLAVDDQGTTLINKPLTFKISSLLSNDTDVDGDSLSLTSVKSVLGGSAVLDGLGNVIFTPDTDFKGQASFDYTISDGKGGTDTGTVSVNVKTASIGTNLSSIRYYSSQVPFLDLFRSSSNWITQTSTVFNTEEQNLLNLDEHGWVKSLKGTGTSQKFDSVGTLINTSINGKYTGGQYVVLYEGEGTLVYGGDAKKNVAASTLGRDVINVTPTGGGISLKITATDPNNTGNYLRNIHIVPIEEEFTYSQNVFNPKFLEKIDPFSTLRFMDWMKPNDVKDSQWSDRPTLDDARWTSGAPVEVMVELANRLDANPWFTIPYLASDDYVTQFAEYVRDHLEPGLKVYIQYANEVWNAGFAPYHYVESLSPTLNVYQTYAQVATHIADLWDNVFGADKDRLIGVLEAQYVNPSSATQALPYAGDSLDVIGLNPYLGRDIGSPANSTQVLNWINNEADGGYNKLFQELTQANVLTSPSLNQRLPALSSVAPQWRKISQNSNLPLVAYEGGQSLVGTKGIENNQAITNLFVNANRDPRMGALYNELLTQWYQVLGGDLFMQFADVAIPGKFGSWGALENLEQTGSPKYDALVNFINEYSG